MSETQTPPAASIVGAAAAGGEGGAAPPAGDAGAPDRAWLPEAFRTDPTFKDIGNVEALAKSYKGAASLVGLDKGQVLRIPAAGDDAAREALFNQLGRPEAPDKYSAWEGAPLDEKAIPVTRETFHKLGLSDAQAAGVIKHYTEQTTAALTARAARDAEIGSAVTHDLRTEWGEAYDERLNQAVRGMRETGGDALIALIDSARLPDGTPFGSNAAVIKAYAKIGAALAEPAGLKGGTGAAGGAGALTPADARAEIARLSHDKAFFGEFSDRQHPKYTEHRARWDELHRQAYPEGA
ncbi:MAG: hypothetical protein ACKVQR_04410 [Aquabacterium sp.]